MASAYDTAEPDGDESDPKQLAARAILDAIKDDDEKALTSALNTFLGNEEPDSDDAAPAPKRPGLGLLLLAGKAKPGDAKK